MTIKQVLRKRGLNRRIAPQPPSSPPGPAHLDPEAEPGAMRRAVMNMATEYTTTEVAIRSVHEGNQPHGWPCDRDSPIILPTAAEVEDWDAYDFASYWAPGTLWIPERPLVFARVSTTGVWCAYLRVQSGHPWFGVEADELEVPPTARPVDYAGRITARDDPRLVNFVGSWCVGFSCAGVEDYQPGMARLMETMRGNGLVPVYRDFPQVHQWLWQLAIHYLDEAAADGVWLNLEPAWGVLTDNGRPF